ncbi:MAG TPA: aspartate/glutamate racemase family protein, partial [Bacteroidia bacterium]|nr:aspartate/glutamate racemase family protein [Bacteroidia bacterium]
QDVKVLHQPCPGLVQQVEAGKLDDPETEKMLREWLDPMLQQGIDTLVLACTHYPFVTPAIKKIVGEKVRVIDPAPAVAKQVQRLLEQQNIQNPKGTGEITYYTTGDKKVFEKMLQLLLGVKGRVEEVRWENDTKLATG